MSYLKSNAFQSQLSVAYGLAHTKVICQKAAADNLEAFVAVQYAHNATGTKAWIRRLLTKEVIPVIAAVELMSQRNDRGRRERYRQWIDRYLLPTWPLYNVDIKLETVDQAIARLKRERANRLPPPAPLVQWQGPSSIPQATFTVTHAVGPQPAYWQRGPSQPFAIGPYIPNFNLAVNFNIPPQWSTYQFPPAYPPFPPMYIPYPMLISPNQPPYHHHP